MVQNCKVFKKHVFLLKIIENLNELLATNVRLVFSEFPLTLEFGSQKSSSAQKNTFDLQIFNEVTWIFSIIFSHKPL